jgi:CRISPR-associated endoribonuclease Cas6
MTDFPDLYALVIRLQPVRGGPPANAQGHGAQALFLDLVRQVDPALAEQLHAAAASKPYTVAVIPPQGSGAGDWGSGARERGPETIELRVTFTRANLFPIVTHALLQRLPGAPLRLGRATLTLADVLGTPGSHPWAGYATFGDLAANARPAATLTLQFATPAAFAQGTRADGRQRLGLLPAPETLFPSIARRWNELAPSNLRLELDAVEAAARDTLVSRYALETTQINLGKGPQKGFLGICTYELPPDPAQARVLSLLADAVFYLGVGMKTARGMGLCRRAEN